MKSSLLIGSVIVCRCGKKASLSPLQVNLFESLRALYGTLYEPVVYRGAVAKRLGQEGCVARRDFFNLQSMYLVCLVPTLLVVFLLLFGVFIHLVTASFSLFLILLSISSSSRRLPFYLHKLSLFNKAVVY